MNSPQVAHSRHAAILGAGVAGMTAAYLLARCGWHVALGGTGPISERWVTLSERTCGLIRDFWGSDVIENCISYRLTGRRVIWAGEDAVHLADPLLAVELSSLVAAIRRKLLVELSGSIVIRDKAAAPEEIAHTPGTVLIDARGRASPEGQRIRCGNRHMRVWPSLPLASPREAVAEMIAGRGFWSFAFPVARDRVCLQIAAPDADQLSDRLMSRVCEEGACENSLLRAAIEQAPDELAETSATFCIAPSLAASTFTLVRFAIGDALMTLDPLCGDGVGHGVKSALLAVAIANSAGVEVDKGVAIAHYRNRVTFAYRTHLRHCRDYYRTIRYPDYWHSEIDAAVEIDQAFGPIPNTGEDLTLTVAGLNRADGCRAEKLTVCLTSEDKQRSEPCGPVRPSPTGLSRHRL